MNIIVKQFAGIGDCLFVTPALHVIKQAYPDSFITYNTNRGSLLKGNPWVDKIGNKNEGFRGHYIAPASTGIPTKHHIIAVWEMICNAYKLQTPQPALKPELYIKDMSVKKEIIGVQVIHKGLWHYKKVWPYFKELAKQTGFQPIPEIVKKDKLQNLVRQIASYKVVVCAEGGISHIARALDIPAIVLFGGFANPSWNGYKEQINIENSVDCSYCYNETPCKGDYKCWKAISVNYVKEIALKKAKQYA